MAKRGNLFQSKKCQDKISAAHKVISIGIVGASFGVGVSHLTFAMATYFIKNRNSIAVVEWGNQKAFEAIEMAYEGKSPKDIQDSFVYKKARFYKKYNNSLSLLKDLGYSFIIVDFGVFDFKILDRFNEMDIKILVGHGNEWKVSELIDVFAEFDDSVTKNWKVVLPYGTKEEERFIYHEIHKKPLLFSFCKDPFLWTNELKDDIERIIGV